MDVSLIEGCKRGPVFVLFGLQAHLDPSDEIQPAPLLQLVQDPWRISRRGIVLSQFLPDPPYFSVEIDARAELVDQVFDDVTGKLLQVGQAGFSLFDNEPPESTFHFLLCPHFRHHRRVSSISPSLCLPARPEPPLRPRDLLFPLHRHRGVP